MLSNDKRRRCLQNQTISLMQTHYGGLDRKRRRALPSLGALAPLNCEFSG